MGKQNKEVIPMSYKILKIISKAEKVKGRGTELITVYIPAGAQVQPEIAKLQKEYTESGNIQSKQTRTSVQDGLTMIINKLKEYGLYKKFYEVGAISYVTLKIATAYNQGHKLKNVPKEIIKWTGIKINKWNKSKKIKVINNYHYKHKKNIVIKYL